MDVRFDPIVRCKGVYMHVDLLDLNYTVFYQWAMFVIGLLIIYYWIFSPVLKVLNAREQRMTESEDGSLDNKAKEQEEAYNQELKRIRGEGTELRRQLRGEAQKKEQQILSETRDEVQKELTERRGQLAQQIDDARGKLKSELPGLTKGVVAQLLGREVNA